MGRERDTKFGVWAGHRVDNKKHCAQTLHIHIYIYVYTHNILTKTKTTQVPNPEAFVLLGEIGYVFRFDNIFFLKRERVCVSFFTSGRRRLRDEGAQQPPSLFRKRDKKSDAMNTTTT